jgi:hypothetical protein
VERCVYRTFGLAVSRTGDCDSRILGAITVPTDAQRISQCAHYRQGRARKPPNSPGLARIISGAHASTEQLGVHNLQHSLRLQSLDDAAGSSEADFVELDRLIEQILNRQARTLEGLFAKAQCAAWALMGDLGDPGSDATLDRRMQISIVRDLVRLFDPTIERPGALSALIREIELNAG